MAGRTMKSNVAPVLFGRAGDPGRPLVRLIDGLQGALSRDR